MAPIRDWLCVSRLIFELCPSRVRSANLRRKR